MDKYEAKLVLSHQLARYRARSYQELLSLLDQVEAYDCSSPSGTMYQIEIEVFYDDSPTKDLRVMGAIDDGGGDAFAPLSDDFIMRPDGTFVDE